MKLYTVQLSQHRRVKELFPDIPILNTTLGSGYKALAPTWDILGHYLRNKDVERYIEAFTERMRVQSRVDERIWRSIAGREAIAFGCYCMPDEFCHRYLLVNHFADFCKKHSIDFEYGGELTPNGIVYSSSYCKAHNEN